MLLHQAFDPLHVPQPQRVIIHPAKHQTLAAGSVRGDAGHQPVSAEFGGEQSAVLDHFNRSSGMEFHLRHVQILHEVML